MTLYIKQLSIAASYSSNALIVLTTGNRPHRQNVTVGDGSENFQKLSDRLAKAESQMSYLG